MKIIHAAFLAASAFVLDACSDMPSGPTVPVMPAPGKPFDVFQEENAYCKQYASEEISGSESGTKNVAGGAAAGAVVGAVAGILLGDSRNAAGAGAATGALFGSAAGAGEADQSARSLQQRYNIAFEQCMYAKGNQVPGYRAQRYAPPPPPKPVIRGMNH